MHKILVWTLYQHGSYIEAVSS